MTLRLKTIEFAFPTDVTSRAANERFDFAAITLYIPETSARVFRSVIAQVTACTTFASDFITSRTVGIKLGAVAFGDAVMATPTGTTSSIANTLFFESDVTAYFQSNFGAGASQTCQIGFLFASTSVTRINTTAKLIITYEYDDAATTRIRTVRIPIESQVGILTTSLAEIGTNQVPALDTFLPEASKVYRNIFFEVTANENANSAVALKLAVALDAEGEVQDGARGVQAGGPWYTFIWVRDDMTTNAVHALKLRSTVASRFHHPAILLVVTYEYDHAASTRIMNSLTLPVLAEPDRLGNVDAAGKTRGRIIFSIEEPGTITLLQSGVHVTYWTENQAANGPIVACGGQAFRTYTTTPNVASTTGPFDLIQRVDSSGAMGAGIALARGENTLTVDAYETTAATVFGHRGISAVLYLNYTSDKAAAGDGAHNHTVVWEAMSQPDVLVNLSEIRSAAVAPALPESMHRITGCCAEVRGLWSSDFSPRLAVDAAALAGDELASGWIRLGYGVAYTGTSSTGWYQLITRLPASHLFRRHPSDPSAGRMLLTAARVWRIHFIRGASATNKELLCLRLFITYHAITFTVAGTVTGYTGDGSGITVYLCRADTGERMASGTTAVGGTYSIVWYDNTIPMFVEARQDETHIGRSDDGLAV